MAKATKKPLGKYEGLFEKYMTKMSSLFSSRAGADVYEQIKAGKSKYLRYERTESSSFDMEWIKEIEDAIFDLGEIIKNPKKTTKTEETIVPAELARKTNATSVRHLASHTQFIKEIDERGNVTPSKILNIGAEDDYATYENRFVATLIRHLVLFIEKRYEYINEFAELKDAEVLMFKNKSVVDGKEVEIESKIRILSDNDVTGTGQSSTYIQRIKEVRRYIRFYYNSPFMKILKNERDVRNPILQTNIIRKNPLYRRAYKLYKFIETYDTLGVNFKINEKYSDFSAEEMEQINATLLANFLAAKGKDPEKGALKTVSKQYKPKVLVSIDDEEFVYSDLLKGPIEFVRVDEAYTSYLETPIPGIPDKPKKEEKEYYEEELKKREDKKALLKAQKALLARKKKEQKEWDKKAEKLVQARLKAEAEERRRIEEELRRAEEARIAAAREELKQDAKEQKLEIKETTAPAAKVDTFEEALEALSKQAKEDLKQEPEIKESETLEDNTENKVEISDEELVSEMEQNKEKLVSDLEQINSNEVDEQELADNAEEKNEAEEVSIENQEVDEESMPQENSSEDSPSDFGKEEQEAQAIENSLDETPIVEDQEQVQSEEAREAEDTLQEAQDGSQDAPNEDSILEANDESDSEQNIEEESLAIEQESNANEEIEESNPSEIQSDENKEDFEHSEESQESIESAEEDLPQEENQNLEEIDSDNKKDEKPRKKAKANSTRKSMKRRQ